MFRALGIEGKDMSKSEDVLGVETEVKWKYLKHI